jgi:polyisoprenyl-phosphate glycosyltransferase
MNNSIIFSVVIPVYNSEETIRELYLRLVEVFETVIKQPFEIIFVDDASMDGSCNKLEELRNKDKRVTVIQLVRNFGQHNAIMCGFHYCRGEFIITLDDDLQNPPEEIPKLIEVINQGYDVVMGEFKQKQHSPFRNTGTWIIDFLLIKILNKPKKIRFTSFRIFRKDVVQRIIKTRSSYCYLAALILINVSPNKMVNITVNHEKRRYGKSNYSLRKLFMLASNLIISYSAIPLRFGIYFGFSISAFCIIYSLCILLRILFISPIKIQGWATLAILTSFLFGILFLFLGIIGEYIYRILRETSANEQFIVKNANTGNHLPL